VNVNFFTTISHTHFKIPKIEPTSFNKLDDSYCALRLEFMNLLQNFYLAVIEYLYRGRRAVARSLCRRALLDTIIVNCP